MSRGNYINNYLSDLYSALYNDIKERKQIDSFTEDDNNLLTISNLNLNVVANAREHHTSDYEQCSSPPFRLVVRRGQHFLLTLECSRSYDPRQDAILLEFTFGNDPKHEKKTRQLVRAKPEGTDLKWKWGARIKERKGRKVVVEVMTSAVSLVGEWRLKILTGIDRVTSIKTKVVFEYDSFIFILFNPWCKDDPVYMPNEANRSEYVLCDSGAVFQGAKNDQYMPCHWNFGQFEDVVLSAVLLVLNSGISGIDDWERGDVVLTTRCLTHLVNDFIVAGQWQPPYDDGTAPWAWTGSVEIFEEFMRSRMSIVKYGQCWVFSAVLTSALRSIGIPTRSVTNISSAHDTDQTLTVDEKYIKDPRSGRFKPHQDNDSIWNFHCWNEAWMERHDLPPGFGGWQACDSTAQEKSQGRYQCGPMSLRAIDAGEVKFNYDGWFIFGEVNADIVKWFYETDPNYPDGLRLLNVDQDTVGVGKCIITSKPGKPEEAVDLTDNYKPKEGSTLERIQMRSAIREVVSEKRNDILDLYKVKATDPKLHDVDFKLADLKQIKLGDTIESTLEIVNGSHEVRTINLQKALYIMRYNGMPDTKIVSVEDEIQIQPFKRQTLYMTAAGESYIAKVGGNNTMSVEVIAHIPQTNQWYSARDTFLIDKPKLYIEAEQRAYKNLPGTATIYFKNPVNMILTDCSLKVEGVGINRAVHIPVDQEIPGCGSFQHKYTYIPRRIGKRRIIGVFNSHELANIRGTAEVIVSEHS